MTATVILVLLLPFLTGFLVASCLWPFPGARSTHLGLKIALGAPLGLGLHALVFFAAMLFGNLPGPGVALGLDAGLLAAALAAFLLVFRAAAPEPVPDAPANLPQAFKYFCYAVLAVLLLVFGTQLYAAYCVGQSLTYGEWDAWAAWNLRAKCMFYDGAHWTDYLSHRAWVPSSDYPMLLTSSILRGWTYAGTDFMLVPGLLGYLFAFAEVGILAFTVRTLKGPLLGNLAGLFLLSCCGVLHWGGSQYGDTPTGCLLLAMLAALALHDGAAVPRARAMLLAGLFGGFALATKMEGMIFILAVLLARSAVTWPKIGFKKFLLQTLCFAAGLLPGVVAFFIVRHHAEALGYLAEQGAQQPLADTLMNKVFDWSRFRQIFAAFCDALTTGKGNLTNWPVGMISLLLFFLVILGVKFKPAAPRGTVLFLGLTVFLILCGYGAIFQMTPMDLREHLATTCFRFFIQVYPSIFLAYFMLVATPEEALAEETAAPALVERAAVSRKDTKAQRRTV